MCDVTEVGEVGVAGPCGSGRGRDADKDLDVLVGGDPAGPVVPCSKVPGTLAIGRDAAVVVVYQAWSAWLNKQNIDGRTELNVYSIKACTVETRAQCSIRIGALGCSCDPVFLGGARKVSNSPRKVSGERNNRSDRKGHTIGAGSQKPHKSWTRPQCPNPPYSVEASTIMSSKINKNPHPSNTAAPKGRVLDEPPRKRFQT